MMNIKVLILIGLTVPGILALSVLESDSVQHDSVQHDSVQHDSVQHDSVQQDSVQQDSVQQDSVQQDFHSEEDYKSKINWGPVWDDIDGSNEFVLRYQAEEKKCAAPKGQGLQNLFKESKKLLPAQGIKEIVDSYANDPEVKALKAFVESSEYKQKVEAIRNSEEYTILKAYACHVLHINLEDNHSDITKNVIRSSQAKGIKGLMHKIQSILPHQKLRDLYQRLMQSDEELVKAVAHLKSDEFKQIVMNLRNNVPAYKELRENLVSIGVPVNELKIVISNVMAWDVDWDVALL